MISNSISSSSENKMVTVSEKFNLSQTSFFICISLIVLIYVLLRINLVSIPLDRDEGVFGYIGQVVNDGGIPYQDAIDHKPPVVFYIYAFALKFFPPTATGIHLFLHLYNLITLLVLSLATNTLTRNRSIALGSVFAYAVLSSSHQVQGFTASTEMFMLLPVVLSLYCLVVALKNETIIWYILSGVFGAVAFWTKQTAAFIILFFVLYAAYEFIHKIRQSELSFLTAVYFSFCWGAGFLSITLFIAGYFYFNDLFDEFFYWSFTHSLIYSQKTNLFQVWPYLSQSLFRFFSVNAMLILPGIVGCLIMIKNKTPKALWAFSFLLFSFISTFPGFAYKHYFAQLLPALSVTTGIGSVYLIQMLTRQWKGLCVFLGAVISIASPVIFHFDYYVRNSPEENSRYLFGFNPFPESVDVADYIKARTSEKDKIFILGSEAQIFVYSQRKSATAFALIYPLMTTYPKYMEFQRRTWSEIQQSNPVYIVSFDFPLSILHDGKADFWIIEQVSSLLSEKYDLEAVMTLKYPKGTIAEANNGNDVRSWHDSRVYPIKIYRRSD